MKIFMFIFCLMIPISAYAVDFDLSWSAPTLREDGTTLDRSEIGGYKVKYKCGTDDEQLILITDNSLESYSFSYDTTSIVCDFSIATYDIDNIYSVFTQVVSVTVLENISPALPPSAVSVTISTPISVHTVQLCTVETNCTLVGNE